MTTNTLRHLKGAPASQGGEFKAHEHDADDISLDVGMQDTRDWGHTGIELGSRTPWGAADYVCQVAPGITRVSTPGHGGVKLSAARNRAVDPALRVKGGWYEEDCDEAIVSFTFPEETRLRPEIGYSVDRPLDEHIAHNDERVRNWFPDGWEKATGKTLQPGESRLRDQKNWLAAHADDYIVVSATASFDEEFVRVIARKGEDTQRFRVPTAEYRKRHDSTELGQDGRFAIDTSRHEKLGQIIKPAELPVPKFSGIRTEGLTAAADSKVQKDLNKRWRLRNGTVKRMSEIIADGITGKGVYFNNGRREYHLEQKKYAGDSTATIFPVSKATWDAVEAPDSRTNSQKLQEELAVASYAADRVTKQARYPWKPTPEMLAAQKKVDEAREAYEASLRLGSAMDR